MCESNIKSELAVFIIILCAMFVFIGFCLGKFYFYNNTIIETEKKLIPNVVITIKDGISDTTYIYKREKNKN